MTIKDIIEGLESSYRFGNVKDEPIGARYIKLSDTLVDEIVQTLKKYVQENE
jgi:hypothetical protein